MQSPPIAFAALAAALLLLPAAALAHKVSSVSLVTRVDTEERTYEISAAMEVAPSDDAALNEEISPEDAARTFAEDFLVLLFDEEEQEPELEIHTETASDENTPEELQRQQVVVNLADEIPEGAAEFLLYLEPECPMSVIMVVVKDRKPSRRMQVVLPGEYSRPVNVEPVAEGDPFEKAGEVEEGKKMGAGDGKKTPEQPVEKDKEKEKARGTEGFWTEAKPKPEGRAARAGAANQKEQGEESGEKNAEKAGEKVPSPFVAGAKSFLEAPFLHPAILLAVLLLGLRFPALIWRLAALFAGQTLGLALSAFGLFTAPAWFAPLAAIGLILCVLPTLLPRRKTDDATGEASGQGNSRRFPLPSLLGLLPLGFVQGCAFVESLPFIRIYGGHALGSASRLQPFHLGLSVTELALALLFATILLAVGRWKGYRRRVAQPLAVILAGYGLYLLAAPYF